MSKYKDCPSLTFYETLTFFTVVSYKNMKAVILAGGLGTRISEESINKPKPMIEIGGKPILWHIMKIYSYHGVSDFIICCGYKGYLIKEYFANYFLHMSDITFDMQNNKMHVHEAHAEPWKVTLVDTGDDSMTGGRIKRIAEYVNEDEVFCLTYGDGVSNVNITDSIRFHQEQGRLATVMAAYPQAKFGALEIEKDQVTKFQEKPKGDNGMVSGGFFVLSPKVIDYIEGDQTSWESSPMEQLVKEQQLSVFKHTGFWQPMDTLRDKQHLEQLWQSGNAPWKVW